MNTHTLMRHALWLFAVLSACMVDDRANRGSIVDNELRVGAIYLPDGTGAVNARIQVFKVDHIPESGDPAYVTRTDTAGRYVLDSLPDGEYNILADLNGQFAFQDSVYVSKQTESISPDTLDEPGTVAGVVGMQPNHDPSSVTVQVLGTDNYTNVDPFGRFRLKGLAAGKYNLRLLTTIPEYTPLFVRLEVASGRNDSLEDTLRIPYTGIPVVTGLRAAYDTLRGVVLLSWNKVEYRDFSEYLVFRDTGLSLTLSQQPIARIKGTAFSDTVRRPSATALFASNDTNDRVLEYRIRVRNLSDQVGLSYGNLPVTAASQAWIRTTITLKSESVKWDSDRLVDSVAISASVTNRSRPLSKISWSLGRQDSVVTTRVLGGDKTARDTLRFTWPRQGAFMVYARVEDGSGTLWTDSIRLPGNSGPTLGGKPDSAAKTLVSYRFAPVASDPDRDSLRFSATSLPAWATLDPITGVMSGTPADSQVGIYSGIVIRVTDGRRTVALPAFAIKVDTNPWRVRPPMPTKELPMRAFHLGNKIYVLGFAGGQVNAFDPSNGSWTRVATLPTGGTLAPGGVDSVGNRLFVFSIRNLTVSPRRITPLALDPITGRWDSLSPSPDTIPIDGGTMIPTLWKGRFLVFYVFKPGKTYMQAEYDPDTDTWTRAKQLNTTFGLDGGGIYSAHTLTERVYISSSNWTFASYDPVSNTWETPPRRTSSRHDYSTCAVDGKIFDMGGIDPSVQRLAGNLVVYDPLEKTWASRTSTPRSRYSHVCTEFGDRVFFFGGMAGVTSGTPTDLVEEYIPAADK